MAKDHGKRIKKDDTYEKLKKQGYSKQKSASIARPSLMLRRTK